MLAAIVFLMVGYIVQQVGVYFRRPSPPVNIAVSAMVGLALGLVGDPFTGIFFTPTVDGLVAATLLASLGGLLFYIAYVMGHRQQ